MNIKKVTVVFNNKTKDLVFTVPAEDITHEDYNLSFSISSRGNSSKLAYAEINLQYYKWEIKKNGKRNRYIGRCYGDRTLCIVPMKDVKYIMSE